MSRHDPKSSALTSADPPRNFSLPVGERIRALTIGVPAWSARKKSIEDKEEELVASLVSLFDGLIAIGASPHEARARMRARAASFDLRRLSRFVADHNRYFPIEANLPMDPATSEYIVRGRPWHPEREPTWEALLARAEALLAR